MAKVIGRMPAHEIGEIQALTPSLIELIALTLEESIEFPIRGRNVLAPKTYEPFANLLADLQTKANPKRSVSVITFNYDLGVDYAMYLRGLGPKYHVDKSDSPHGIPLLKLHGSLNWARCPDCQSILPLHLAEYFKRKTWVASVLPMLNETVKSAKLQMRSEFATLRHCQSGPSSTPVLVPPTWNKADYHSSLAEVWRQASDELGEAEYIIVIGYSFPMTDAFFQYLYALGTVGRNPLERFWVFDPDTKVADRFRTILGPAAANTFHHDRFVFSGAIDPIRREFKL